MPSCLQTCCLESCSQISQEEKLWEGYKSFASVTEGLPASLDLEDDDTARCGKTGSSGGLPAGGGTTPLVVRI